MNQTYEYVDYNPATGRWGLPMMSRPRAAGLFRKIKLHYLLHRFRQAKRKHFYEKAIVDPSTMRPSVV